jgi:hypothetical protein
VLHSLVAGVFLLFINTNPRKAGFFVEKNMSELLVIARSSADYGIPTELDTRLQGLIPHPELFTDFEVPIESAFTNWEPIVTPVLHEGMLLVEFKSQTRSDTDDVKIAAADAAAAVAARNVDGYGGYYPGHRDSLTRRSRSFCIWESPKAAMESGKDPVHQLAMKMAKEEKWYERHDVPRYTVRKGGTLFELPARHG